MDMTVNPGTIDQDSPGVNLMPPAVFYTCLICGAVLEFVFPLKSAILPTPLRIVAGVLLGGAGLAIMLAAHETFKRNGTAVPTNRAASRFVVKGPYRFSRNPMYAGGSAFFLGIGLAAGSWWIIALYLPLAFYLAFYVVPREEDYLERQFGEAFRQYRGKVRRWI